MQAISFPKSVSHHFYPEAISNTKQFLRPDSNPRPFPLRHSLFLFAPAQTVGERGDRRVVVVGRVLRSFVQLSQTAVRGSPRGAEEAVQIQLYLTWGGEGLV